MADKIKICTYALNKLKEDATLSRTETEITKIKNLLITMKSFCLKEANKDMIEIYNDIEKILIDSEYKKKMQEFYELYQKHKERVHKEIKSHTRGIFERKFK